MTSPNWYFDGDLRRIYEVPPHPTYTTDPNGYRIYTSTDPSADALVYVNIKKDLWSRWVDWAYTHQWGLLAFSRSGGAFRGYDEQGNELYQSVDFTLLNDNGWKIVLANYPHETRFKGNLYAQSDNSIFDNDRIDCVPPPIARLEGAADLLSYIVNTGSGLSPEEQQKLDWIRRRLAGDEERRPNRIIVTDPDTGETLLDKVVTGGQLTQSIKIYDS